MNKELCPKCNAERAPGDTECNKCGVIFAKVEKAATLKAAKKDKQEPIKFSYRNAGIAAGIIFLLIVGIFIYGANQHPYIKKSIRGQVEAPPIKRTN